jgi:serine/threonine protein kinase/WD40 repeat protein/tetratricopeptide (TPR) repeat protein
MASDAAHPELDPVDRLVEEYLGRRRRGEHPTPAEYAARFPELGERILELFPALELIEGLKPAPEDDDGVSDDPGVVSGPAGLRDRPRKLGDYALLRELGRGGMGIVYEAERASLKNRVALKVMHTRFRTDRAYLRRFQTEARSAAKLHHTNIVPVFDYGEQDGVCYYAMQYIDGVGLELVLQEVRHLRVASPGDLTAATAGEGTATEAATGRLSVVSHGLLTGRFADAPTASLGAGSDATAPWAIVGATPGEISGAAAGGPTSAPSGAGVGSVGSSFAGQAESVYFREVARLGAQVADALEHAHRQGVVHRDIKPSNLLLDAQGNVWVTDFGLAKLLEGDDLSQSHELVGTMRFMPPERFRGVTDRRGDIYALGATLYELLTLRPAFAAADQARLLDQIAHEPPAPLRKHDRRIPRDLETLVLKAMAKDPDDRFAAAGELAEELRRFLESRPIRSRPTPAPERLWRWCRRNPWLAGANIAAATLMTLLAIGATIAASTFYHQRDRISHALVLARDSEADAITAKTEARVQLLGALQARARAGRFSRRVGQRFESLDALARATALARELKLPPDRFDSLRDEAIACLALPDMKPAGPPIRAPEGVIAFAFDAGMTRYAIRLRDRTILVRRMGDDQEIARFAAQGDRDIWVFAFSPDGKYLATNDHPSRAVAVWDVDRGALCVRDPGPVRTGWAARFSPDSRRIAVAHGDRSILVYDLKTGQCSRRWNGPAPAQDLAFRPDGGQIAVVYSESQPTCRILDADTGQQVRAISIPVAGSVAWSPDGTTLAIADDDKISLWNAATGDRGATLVGATNRGLRTVFHPAGTVLASNGWEGQLRLWDPVLGRQVLSLTGYQGPDISQDGRIFVGRGNEFSPWQVDPAIEYRTLAHASSEPQEFARPSIHRDGWILAVGTDRGVVLWNLARGTELAFLRIGQAWHSTFEPSGDLLTNGSAGVLRWPIHIDPTSSEARIGPPRSLPLQGTDCEIAEDRTGQIVAVAGHSEAYVALGDRTIRIGPLDDCRGVSVSPDGQWLATGNHNSGGVTIWRLPDGARVTRLPIDGGTGALFSPDGRWLMTERAPCRLWEVGTWREARQIEGGFLRFSPDGRLAVVQDKSKVLGLVEIATGRTLARLESPDQYLVGFATFSPDGSRLVVATNEPPCVHVWDLRAIRRQLAEMGLDWDAPAYPENDAASPDLPPLPPLKVNYGPLTGHLEHFSERPEPLVERYSARIKQDPNDFEAYHHRAHALWQLNRMADAIDDLSHAIRLRPDDAHLLHLRAQVYARGLNTLELAIADLEAALVREPSRPQVRELLAECCNNLARVLAVHSPSSPADLNRALRLSLRAVELAPGQQLSLNTRGVVLYRAGQSAAAVTILEKSLEAGHGQFDAFDLFFLAMAHHRLGHRGEARRDLDRAITWMAHPAALTPDQLKELASFRTEAGAVLAGPAGELPEDVFAH